MKAGTRMSQRRGEPRKAEPRKPRGHETLSLECIGQDHRDCHDESCTCRCHREDEQDYESP
jgi:hypothetical protein